MGIDSTRTVPSAVALLLAALLSAPALAAGTNSTGVTQEDICQQVACRESTTVRLWTDDGAVLEGELPPGPYVLDGVINVLAGESFKVDTDDSGGRFLSLRYGQPDGDPDRALTVSLEQMVSETGNEMIFSIENPLPHAVKFRLAANPAGSPELIYTRTCPVASGDWAYEKWQGPIAQLVVFDVQILESESLLSAACD